MDFLKGKKAIIFDWDGTLVDSLDMWNEVDRQLILKIASDKIKQQLLTDLSWQQDIYSFRTECLRKHQSKEIYEEYVNELIRKFESSYSPSMVNKMRDNIAEYYMTNLVLLKDGSVELLNYLKRKGYYLILATAGSNWCLNLYATYNKNINSVLNMHEMFDLILTKNDVQNKKPNPEIYLKASELSGFKVEDCIAFEDSLEGIEAAFNSGIDVINVYDRHADNDRERIEQITLISFMNFTQILKVIEANNTHTKKYEI